MANPSMAQFSSTYSNGLDSLIRSVLHDDDDDISIKVKINSAKSFSNHLMEVTDVDIQDKGKPDMLPGYVNDVYSHLWELEDKHLVVEDFLKDQDIRPYMRAEVIDWLIELQEWFQLVPETLYSTVGIMDRFLQVDRDIPCNQLQLVAVTAMFIASKFEDTMAPRVTKFPELADDLFTTTDILAMELRILNAINYNVSFPVSLHFLRRKSKVGSVTLDTHILARYLVELCLTEYHMSHYKPSIQAAEALCLSLKLMGGQDWTDNLVYYSRYREEDLIPVMCTMAAIVKNSTNGELQAARNKFATDKFNCISYMLYLESEFIDNLAARAIYVYAYN